MGNDEKELTNDIPNVSEEATKDLNGMIKNIGAENRYSYGKNYSKENQILRRNCFDAIFGIKQVM
jgi:hypothetical protein